jgi:D-alanine-D-alanine ligase
MRIGLTYNLKSEHALATSDPSDRFEEFDSIETIEALEDSFRLHGHEAVRLGWGAAMLDRLRAKPVDGVFNLAEGIGGRGRESQVPGTLEMLGIPCSGADAVAIGITLDKALAKLLARANGIPTAPFQVADRRSQAAGKLRYPLFVKPSCEGSSMGITATSRCENERELRAAVDRLSVYGPVLVEEFLPGDEFTVGIIGGEVLGVMQVVPRTNEKHFIYSLEVKRDYAKRVEYRLVDRRDVADVALSIWRAFGLRDFSRVDVRCDRDGRPNFVEVNPLPGVHPVNSDLVILARGMGWSYERLIGRILEVIIARWSPAD